MASSKPNSKPNFCQGCVFPLPRLGTVAANVQYTAEIPLGEAMDKFAHLYPLTERPALKTFIQPFLTEGDRGLGALKLYTAEAALLKTQIYKRLNQALREAIPKDLEHALSFAKLVSMGMKSLDDVPTNTTTFRGMAGDLREKMPDRRNHPLAVGSVHVFQEFLSTSLDRDTAENFGRKNSENDFYTILEVKVSEGAVLGQSSANSSEREVLLAPGAWFLVERIEEKQDEYPPCPRCKSMELFCKCGENRNLCKVVVHLRQMDYNTSVPIAPPPKLPTAPKPPQIRFTPQELPKPPQAPDIPPPPQEVRPNYSQTSSKTTGFRKHAAVWGKEITMKETVTGIKTKAVGSSDAAARVRAREYIQNEVNAKINQINADNAAAHQATVEQLNTEYNAKLAEHNQAVERIQQANMEGAANQNVPPPDPTSFNKAVSGAKIGGAFGAGMAFVMSTYSVTMGKESKKPLKEKINMVASQTGIAGAFGAGTGFLCTLADSVCPLSGVAVASGLEVATGSVLGTATVKDDKKSLFFTSLLAGGTGVAAAAAAPVVVPMIPVVGTAVAGCTTAVSALSIGASMASNLGVRYIRS